MGTTVNPVMVTITTSENAPVLTDEIYNRHRSDVHELGANHHSVGDVTVSVLEAYRSGRTQWEEISESFQQLWEHWSRHSLGGLFLLHGNGDDEILDNVLNQTDLHVSLFDLGVHRGLDQEALVARSTRDTICGIGGGLIGHGVLAHVLAGHREEAFSPVADLVVVGDGYEHTQESSYHIRIRSAAPGQAFELFEPTPVRVSEEEQLASS